jgi:ABC-type uncharacterized transport system auxiliary subunit
LRAQLLDIPARKVTATQVFKITEESKSDDAVGGMGATNRAVEKFLEQLIEFTKKFS